MSETHSAGRRRLLPVLNGSHGGRSAMTCTYRCADACSHPAPNTSDNEYFGDMAEKAMSRRGLLRTGALAAFVVGTGSATALATAPAAAARPVAAVRPPGDNDLRIDPPELGRPIGFLPVGDNTVDAVVVPNGYDWSVVMAWGDPVEEGAPDFDFDNQTVEAQLKQFGYNADFVAVLPLDRNLDRALLCVNHEYTNENLMFHGWSSPAEASVEQLRIAMAAHGFAVVEIERVGDTGEWKPAKRRKNNRRIHTGTDFVVVGPAAGSDLLKTSADPSGTKVLGTLNNCAGGVTPWGTVLSGEENFHQYFGATAAVTDPLTRERYARYGIRTTIGTSRGWERAEQRFDVAAEPNEPNRHGWIVEIDPYDPTSTPRKLTALGRFKHEGATIAIADDGRAVAYMGDDERYDYVYKFVSSNTYRQGTDKRSRQHNLTLLDEGDLYVARFTGNSPEFPDSPPDDGLFDGTGEWLPLIVNGESKVDGMSVEEVLVFTRLAADKVGPTKMDRPEDVEPNPVTGTVYIALTNNTRRTPGEVDEANPRPENKFGHVIALDEDGSDAAATTFTWSIVIVCGNPDDPETYYDGFDKSQVSQISCPDNVAFDPSGRLWISTDGMPGPSGVNDGMYVMPVEGEDKGHLRRFLSVPTGAECCGPAITPDGRTALMAVQHPGEVDGATTENRFSTFPYGDQPRPAVVTVWRKTPDGVRPYIGD
ncbi:PhoX family phosphatase [Phytoactinopolyspora alkaliphila]|uniref:PhoX family phosphatase n=1 Tax=Phytoactinopolyspora alkaliphila TaxID=1783498 RepID=A0A6N9YMC1_9ACTN|nr:PhoX family phosphatase [Phytoactinopolyspora alkaliphila]NED96143.1 PhoX family phosphatase [Phytoactinopolyspora alkaliphila]